MEEKDNSSKPRVTVFGQDLNAEDEKEERRDGKQKHKHHRGCGCCGEGGCGSGAWGFAVLLAGIMLLFNTIGLVPWEVWQFIWPFWPALLVLLGISIFLGRNAFARLISSLLALAVFLTIFIYSLMAVKSPMADYFPGWLTNFVSGLNINLNNK